MATTTKAATILLASTNAWVIEATRTILAKVEKLHLIEKEVNKDNLFQVIAETQPDVILLDFKIQPQPFFLTYKIASEFPMSAVVAILSEAKMVKSYRAVQAGAQAFIQFPFPSDSLIFIIKRVMERFDPTPTISTEAPIMDTTIINNKMFTVFSPKGGAGSTTIATNLAISLHKTLKEDVLLVDGKHLFGHVALYLNLRTGNSITDLIAHAGTLDERMIQQVVVKHTSGIHVLPSPISIPEAQGINPEDLFNVIQSLKQVFPYIIIDGGNTLNENAVTYMDSSDKILLVLNPDLASMRDVRQFMEISATLSYPKEKTLLILNLTGRKSNVESEEIENILDTKIFGSIPSDENLALSSLNEGVPILLKKPRHPISKAFSEITKDLVNRMQTPETE